MRERTHSNPEVKIIVHIYMECEPEESVPRTNGYNLKMASEIQMKEKEVRTTRML
jgi:hypothetical protein